MTINEREVRQRFSEAGYFGAVALIDYLTQRRSQGIEIIKIGSGTIFGDPTKAPKKPEQLLSLSGFSLGTVSATRLPIEDLAMIELAIFKEKNSVGNSIMDSICKDLSLSDHSKLTVMVAKTEVSRRFIFNS